MRAHHSQILYTSTDWIRYAGDEITFGRRKKINFGRIIDS